MWSATRPEENKKAIKTSDRGRRKTFNERKRGWMFFGPSNSRLANLGENFRSRIR